ncbi:TonB-dependent receptor [Brevundimonas sp. BAL450]|uniref:TonB-dependent receptor n=1 Tax=Brevundimonas sp. BAL450 TaxID=1708162 RepID=UPI0018CB14F6|nr:TonB-dependent receptor [Brevundimonas sp. BAL450]MBG7614683.1 TonB-dependent receptor [Brevundimonas sp. BAL450]
MRMGLCTTAAAALMAAAAPAWTQTAAAVRDFDVPGGPLGPALAAFARQSGDQILYPADLVAGRTGQPVRGQMTSREALERLLDGAGLAFRQSRPDVFVLYDPAQRSGPDQETTVLDEIVITGTLLRGTSDGPSPVVVVSRDDMDRRGHGTVADALADLPQNFGGSGNEAAITAGADRAGGNAAYASGVNLRGLGSDATLVLINGRRLAGSGSNGDFADISTIPASAVSRIDVLLDGASALYGADAVGGVVNIILRQDYEGAETRLRLGATADGAMQDRQIGQTLGRRWSGGSLLAVYEFNQRDAFAAADRRRASDADLRWLGGSDRRQYYSNPGNILIRDPVLGETPAYAIPPGQDGSALQPGDFLAGQVNLFNMREGVNIVPRQTRHSGFLAWTQKIGERVELSADARYGHRAYDTVAPGATTVLTVTDANPHFVSPVGAISHNIAYAFHPDLGNPVVSGKAESFGATFGASITLPAEWRLNSYLAYATEGARDRTVGLLNSTLLREALGSTPDNPDTAFSTARDGFFNPFGDGSNSPAAVLDFIGSGWTNSEFDTRVTTAHLQLDGTVLHLPAGPLRLAVGAAVREEDFRRRADNFTAGAVPAIGAPVTASRQVASVFSEARLPLFGPAYRRPGLERLELSLAARFEDYGDVGQTLSPKIGLLWEPRSDLLVRANYGESFRAPALREINDAPRAGPSILPRGSSQILSMILYGGNPDLEPEEAQSWTVGAEYRPSIAPGLRLSLNAFRIAFDNRIGQPTSENILTALSDPSLSAFIRVIDPANNAADRADMQAILDQPTTSLRDLFPATAYGAIVDARYVNTARVTTQGVDLGAAWPFTVGAYAFNTGVNLTYLDRFDAQSTPTSPVVSQLDRPNYPVSLRGRTHLGWSRENWSGAVGVSHVTGYRDLTDTAIGSWTTFDLSLRYEPTAGPLAGTAVTLNVDNLFDRAPPFYDSPAGVAYDAANADVRGRYLSLQLVRSW